MMRSIVTMAGLMILTLSGMAGGLQGEAADQSQTRELKGLHGPAEPTARRCYLVKQGVPQATLVVGKEAGTLTWRAARVFADLARQWLRADLPIRTDRDWQREAEARAEQNRDHRTAYLVIGDARRNKLTARLVENGLTLPPPSPPNSGGSEGGEEGYAVQWFTPTEARTDQGVLPVPYLVLAGGSARSEYYAAEYLRRLHCDTAESDLWVELPSDLRREPAFPVRANYFLTCWNNAHYFTLDYYKDALDSMAAAGTNAVFFWVAGLYESERYPETYRLRPSVMQPPQIRQLIDHAHSLGMEFYLLDGLCGWSLGLAFPGKYPEVRGTGVLQCPAQPLSTELYLGYLKEQLAYFPNADGFAYEMGSEYGMCQCPLCSKVIDQHGSHAFGQYQLDFLEKSTQALWAEQPNLKFVYNIGYDCNEDVAYYQRLHALKDPRLRWWIVRQNWTVPGGDGQPSPIQEVLAGQTLLHWDPLTDLSTLLAKLPRVQQTGMAGYVTSGSPDAQHPLRPDREPYFPESLPFQIERLAYHLLTWEPRLTEDQVWEAVRRAYFSADLRDERLWTDFRWLVTDAWKTVVGSWEHELFMVRNHVPYASLPDSMEGWKSLTSEKVRQIEEDVPSLKYLTPEQGQQLYDFLGRVRQVVTTFEPRFREIEERMAALPHPSAKTADTLRQMQQQIDDLRSVLTSPSRLTFAQQRLVEAGLAHDPGPERSLGNSGW